MPLIGRGGDEDQAGDVVLTGMPGAVKAVDGDRVDSQRLGLDRVAHGSGLMDDLDAGWLEDLEELGRIVARRFHYRDARLHDRLGVFHVRRRCDRRQDG
jgi:hypothetical protein